MRRDPLTSTVLTTLLLGSVATAAEAQSAPSTDTSASGTAGQKSAAQADTTTVAANPGDRVEDIVVTAQRREQNLQKVPLAVSAFSANSLAALRVTNSTELLRFVPNVIGFNNANQASQANYYFRGIGVPDAIQTLDSPVVTYLDDVVLGRIAGANIQFLDLERVEVLRGPQGTLFGRNVTGGAIAYYTRKPADTYQAKLELAYGERNRVETKAAVDVPLSDTLFSNITAYYQREDGFFRSVATGADDIGAETSYGARLAFRYVPSTRLTWDLAADYSSQNQRAVQAPGLTGATVSDGQRQNPSGTLFDNPHLVNELLLPCDTGSTPRDWVLNNCSAAIARNAGITSNIKIDIGGPQLNFITGARRTDSDYAYDNNLNNPLNATPEFILANRSRYYQLSQEAKLAGGLFSDRLKYVGGLFYFHEVDKTLIDDFLTPKGGTRTANTHRDLRNTTESYAAYLQTDLEIVPNLTLTTGLRYTHDHKAVAITLDNARTGALIFNTSQIAGPPAFSSEKVTPHVSLQYQVTPAIMTYVSYTKGFKSGGWNGRATSAVAFTSFGDENVDSYEVGARTQLFNNRLRFNITGFIANYKGLQINTAFTPPSTGVSIFITDNAGNSRDRGVEIESNFVLTNTLTGNFSAGFQKGKFTFLTPGAIAAGLTLDSPLPQTPDQTYAAGLTWSHDTGNLGKTTLTVSGQYIPSYNPAITANSRDTADLLFVNGTLGFAPTDHVDVAIECRNCIRSYKNIIPNTNGNQLYVLPYYGVRLRYKI